MYGLPSIMISCHLQYVVVVVIQAKPIAIMPGTGMALEVNVRGLDKVSGYKEELCLIKFYQFQALKILFKTGLDAFE